MSYVPIDRADGFGCVFFCYGETRAASFPGRAENCAETVATAVENKRSARSVVFLVEALGGSEKSRFRLEAVQGFAAAYPPLYLELVYLVTALVPSDTACLASSPGRRSLTAVWISRLVMVDLRL